MRIRDVLARSLERHHGRPSDEVMATGVAEDLAGGDLEWFDRPQ